MAKHKFGVGSLEHPWLTLFNTKYLVWFLGLRHHTLAVFLTLTSFSEVFSCALSRMFSKGTFLT